MHGIMLLNSIPARAYCYNYTTIYIYIYIYILYMYIVQVTVGSYECLFNMLFFSQIIDPYNTDTVEIAFMTSDYDTPAYLLAYGYPIIVDSFTNSPPSYSRLDIPIECLVAKKALKVKGEKGKNKAHFKRRDIFSKIF